MVRNNKSYNTIKLVLVSVLAIVSILIYFFPSESKVEERIWQEKSLNNEEDISFVNIREDSLIKVLGYFTQQMNSTYKVDQSNTNDFSLYMARFGSNPAIVYSANRALLTTRNKDARIEVTPTGDISAKFRKFKSDGVYYVKVPSDVLFGLMKLHPNVR
jgi:hypothetical protein